MLQANFDLEKIEEVANAIFSHFQTPENQSTVEPEGVATMYMNWRRHEWYNVLFSDEFLFILIRDVYSSEGNVPHETFLAFVLGSDRFGGREGRSHGCTHLHKIQIEVLIGRRHRDEIIRTIVVLYAAAIGYDVMLMTTLY
ncbi:hypothetical protein TNCV_4954661 [Trichonephila clavipes]|nr:hypothetical protein TNCV_4954661 [Trichonephila clavipes]